MDQHNDSPGDDRRAVMDRESALLTRWRSERPMYAAWGEFVADRIGRSVAVKIGAEESESFFKIPISTRTKLEKSLVDKAFHRKKPYADPYGDIEDKVGVRVVLLFKDDVRTVEEVILACEDWSATKARDFEEELMLRPYEFDYQSVHYIVRSKSGIRWNGTDIAKDVPCEVQIRTLLQHAYSELTHDTIYKPSVAADPSVKRAAAKSMALIEATGDYFTEVRAKLALAAAPGDRVAATVDRLYTELVGAPEPSTLNAMLVDRYKARATEGFDERIASLFREKAWLSERIAERATSQALYRQPAILLVYWNIDEAPSNAAKDSPLTDSELALMYSDLGRSIPT
ncbi:MAG TPA: RelA/SpoT domain-containing protein [Candidatus Cybelea sp.]|jgi:ppGpp synthetase/RelA/SpoT-type nucleotidyltranferase|nr:RelA/SpoT domain-containing protein [Candidatus Cybelea sp.]